MIKKKLLNRTFLVTAGPTHEMIDPARYIGNYSTGKMGFAIAEKLAEYGADVILVSGPVSLNANHKNIRRIDVVSAVDMYNKAIECFESCDGAVMAAAVADYAPVEKSGAKIKRGEGNYTVELRPNPDIAASLGKIKRSDQQLIGFALETDDEEKNAIKKLKKKNLDFIVLNSLRDKGAGFGVDTNKVTIIDKDGCKCMYGLKSKSKVAEDIVEKIIETQHTI